MGMASKAQVEVSLETSKAGKGSAPKTREILL